MVSKLKNKSFNEICNPENYLCDNSKLYPEIEAALKARHFKKLKFCIFL